MSSSSYPCAAFRLINRSGNEAVYCLASSEGVEMQWAKLSLLSMCRQICHPGSSSLTLRRRNGPHKCWVNAKFILCTVMSASIQYDSFC